MLRTMTGILVSAVLVGSLTGSPAQAGHGGSTPPPGPHEAMPTDVADFLPVPEGQCVMSGAVHIDDQNGTGGIDATPRHNHWVFVDTLVDCISAHPLLDQTFAVHWDSGSDGPSDVNGHGETTGDGWTHSSDYGAGSNANWDSDAAATCDGLTGSDVNKGDIWLKGLDTLDEASGWVKFVRSGTHVVLWGCATTHDDPQHTILFNAELELQFEEPETGTRLRYGYLHGPATIGLHRT